VVLGKTTLIAAGKPVRSSQQAIRISLTPLFFSSFSTESQNFAPSFAAAITASVTLVLVHG
jgi:hypothetical protein